MEYFLAGMVTTLVITGLTVTVILRTPGYFLCALSTLCILLWRWNETGTPWPDEPDRPRLYSGVLLALLGLLTWLLHRSLRYALLIASLPWLFITLYYLRHAVGLFDMIPADMIAHGATLSLVAVALFFPAALAARHLRLHRDCQSTLRHELRSPLSSVTLACDLLEHRKDPPRPEPDRAVIARIRRAVARIEAQIQRLGS